VTATMGFVAAGQALALLAAAAGDAR
jgi:hypothetical protein